MVDRDRFSFTDEGVPARYDELLAPRLFQPWAKELVALLKPRSGSRALDVATGPGTVARVLAAVIGPKGQVAACDSSPAMIARAESKGDVPNGAPIGYTVAPAAPLPYPDASFDAVTCQQGLQFFPDAQAALVEMRRVLTARGKVIATVWHPIEACRPALAFMESLAAAGLAELAELTRLPHPRWTGEELADRARAAGFRKVDVATATRPLEIPGGAPGALNAFSGTPIGALLATLEPSQRAALDHAAARCFQPLLVDGAVRGPMTAWVLTGKA